MAVVSRGESGEPAILLVYRLVRAYWALAVPLVFVLRFLYYKYASPLRKYPGPLLASGSRAWKGKRDSVLKLMFASLSLIPLKSGAHGPGTPSWITSIYTDGMVPSCELPQMNSASHRLMRPKKCSQPGKASTRQTSMASSPLQRILIFSPRPERRFMR